MNNPDLFFLDVVYWNYLTYRKINRQVEPLEFGLGKPLSEAFIKSGISSVHSYANDLESQTNWLINNCINGYNLVTKILMNISNNTTNYNSKSKKVIFYTLGLYIALRQIQLYRPKVVWCLDPKNLHPFYVKEIKKLGCKLVGHISSRLPNPDWLDKYDLLLSSHPGFIENWSLRGNHSKLFKPFYDANRIKRIPWSDRDRDLVFLGSNSRDHDLRLIQLDELSKHFDIQIYGSGFEKVKSYNYLKKNLKGQIWGEDVYRLYQSAKVAFNSHIDLAQGYSANVRMIEVAGSGAVLLTEKTKNLNEYFGNDEVMSYSSTSEAIEIIRYLQRNDDQASQIASKGQLRVERDHTSTKRVIEFSELILNL